MIITTRDDLVIWAADVRCDLDEHGLTEALVDAIQAADHPGWGDDWGNWLDSNVDKIVEVIADEASQ